MDPGWRRGDSGFTNHYSLFTIHSMNDLPLLLGVVAAAIVAVLMTRLSARAHRDDNERERRSKGDREE
jgi:hypothetical protein